MAVILVENEPLSLAPLKVKKEGEDDPNEDRNPNEIWALKKIAELRKVKKFKFINNQPIQKEKILFKPKPSWDLAANIMNPETGVSEKWTFCARPKREKNGDTRYPTHHYRAPSITSFTLETDKEAGANELIFFLSILNLKQFGYFIEDKRKIAQEKMDKRRLDLDTQKWIYDRLQYSEVRKLAYRYNISNIEEAEELELRHSLYEKVAALDKNINVKQGFQTFLNEFEADMTYTSIVAHLNKAVKDKIIEWDRSHMNIRYTKSNMTICQIPPERWDYDKEEFVAEWLLLHEKERNIFFGACAGLFDMINAEQQRLDEQKHQENVAKAKIFRENPILDNVTHHTHIAKYLELHNLDITFPDDVTTNEQKVDYIRKYEQEMKESQEAS